MPASPMNHRARRLTRSLCMLLADARMLQSFLISILVALLVQTPETRAIPIDNGVEDTTVSCSQDSILVNFKTRNPFTGRIFVKGMSDNPSCVENFSEGGSVSTNPEMTFTFGGCNMQRSRTLSPQKGMMQSIVVIISFHRIFITKVDKAYKVQCFYMEAEKTVTSQLEVSMITTQSLEDQGRMPTCEYSVRRGSKDGEVVKFARIGEPVFHEWECDSENHRILVKNCFVDDGQGNKYEILDDKGCAIDPVILNNLEYEPNGMAKAWVEAHVFKFADRPTVFFQCTIQICNRGEATCDSLSPPQCDPLRLPVESHSTQQELPTTSYTEYYSSDEGIPSQASESSVDYQLDSSPQSITQPAAVEAYSTDYADASPISDDQGTASYSDYAYSTGGQGVTGGDAQTGSGGTSVDGDLVGSVTSSGSFDSTVSGRTGSFSADFSIYQNELSTSSNSAQSTGATDDVTSPTSLNRSTSNFGISSPLPDQFSSQSSQSSASSAQYSVTVVSSNPQDITLLDFVSVQSSTAASSSASASESSSVSGTTSLSSEPTTPNGTLPRVPAGGGTTRSRTAGPAPPRFRYRYHRSVPDGERDGGVVQYETPEKPSFHEVDLFSNSISVMDLDESSDGREPEDQAFNRLVNRPFGRVLTHIEEGICMSAVGFGIMLSLVILVFLIAIVVAILLCYGKTRTDYKA